jgi:hypothetical protein
MIPEPETYGMMRLGFGAVYTAWWALATYSMTSAIVIPHLNKVDEFNTADA